jgi:hypothetical protein
MLSEQHLKQEVLRTLDALPREKLVEVLDFARFLQTRGVRESTTEVQPQAVTKLTIRTVPASHLDSLTGLVAWGGDAVEEAERLYDDDRS